MTIRAAVGQYMDLTTYNLAGQEAAPAADAGRDQVQQERIQYSNGRKVLERELQGKTTDLLSPMTPFSVRQVIIANHNAEVEAKGRSDGDYIRMKSFWGGSTIGFAFTLLARLIRIVFRVAFIWLSVLVATYQQCTYGKKMREDQKYNIVAEDLRRIGYEFIDLGTTLLTPFISLVNFFAPRAISTAGLRDYYMNRIDQIRKKNAIFNAARTAYNAEQADKHAAWNAPVPQ